jgi:hypothetical protein
VLRMIQAEYLGLVDHTGRQIHAGKRGAITGPASMALSRLGVQASNWSLKVMAVGSGFSQAIGDEDSLIERARAMGQCWLRGIGTARTLANATR